MLSKRKKRLISVVCGTLAVLLLAINGVLIWVMTGPRSLPFFTPYLEGALLPAGSSYKADINDTILYWNGWQHPLSMKVTGVKVISAKGEVFSEFPEISVRLSTLALLTGNVVLNTLELSKPSISLFQNDDGTIVFGISESAEQSTGSTTDFADMLALMQTNDGMRSLYIHNARVRLGNQKLGVFLESPDAEIEVRKTDDGFRGNITLDLLFDDKTSRIDADFRLMPAAKQVHAELVFTDIEPGMLARLMPENEWLRRTDMPVSGWVSVDSDWEGNVSRVELDIDAGPGIVTYDEEFEKPLNVQSLELQALFKDNLNTLEVTNALLRFDKPVLRIAGTVKKHGEDYEVDVKAEGESMPVDELRNYWPKTLAPKSRKWVTGNIGKGTVPKASVALKFAPGELKLRDTPDEAVAAEITVQDASVRYLPKHPPVENVNGVVKFTGKTMRIEANSGTFLADTRASRALLASKDLNAKDTRMQLDMDVDAGAKDIVKFLSLPGMDHAKKLNLLEDAISGRASGNVKLDFIAFSEDDDKEVQKEISGDNLDFDIKAEIVNAAQKEFLNKMDVAAANGAIHLTNKALTFAGKATVNGAPMQIDLKTGLRKADATLYTIVADMPAASLAAFGYGGLDFLKGTLGVNATFNDLAESQTVSGTVDLTDASVKWPEYTFDKPVGKKATLTFETESGQGETRIKQFDLLGADIKVAGSAAMNKQREFIRFKAGTVRYGDNDVSVDYAKKGKGFTLGLKGKSVNISSYLDKGDSEFSSSHIVDMDIDAEVDKVLLGDGKTLSKVKAKIVCDAKRCHTAKIESELLPGKNMRYGIATKGGSRVVEASADDAGEMARALGIFPNMGGGLLSLSGTFDDDKAGSPLTGTLTVKEYSLRDAPVLTRLLTIASLTGLIDSLSGKGLTFQKMKVPFTYVNDVITVKDAKTYGSSIGISMDGTISLKNTELNLKGTFVPAYAVNTLLGNIPIIGELAGGKDGGLIAANFTIKGPYADPQIMVNPLSMLTPGFLRGLFDIFDGEGLPDGGSPKGSKAFPNSKGVMVDEKKDAKSNAGAKPAKEDVKEKDKEEDKAPAAPIRPKRKSDNETDLDDVLPAAGETEIPEAVKEEALPPKELPQQQSPDAPKANVQEPVSKEPEVKSDTPEKMQEQEKKEEPAKVQGESKTESFRTPLPDIRMITDDVEYIDSQGNKLEKKP